MTLKVCHLSSAHQGLDVRIFHKQCAALANAGYETHLVIRANQQEVDTAAKKNVQVHALDAPKSRPERMIKQAWRCYRLGRTIDADIYQFHGIDSQAVFEACGKVLSENAMETVRLNQRTLQQASTETSVPKNWRELWEQS